MALILVVPPAGPVELLGAPAAAPVQLAVIGRRSARREELRSAQFFQPAGNTALPVEPVAPLSWLAVRLPLGMSALLSWLAGASQVLTRPVR